ncbi:MAG: bifunctional glutamate N-acetyltransferase/amino-acid acetyltransferase ArgJ [Dehalococcoidales bacterium]|nr:MAG: bifunctional glutamate N-acetyltransferase/amino-acid acetyltransferase ArgJ [Dehalococcoidales bacterium]
METKIDTVNDGTATSPQGFHAGATAAEIKQGSGDKQDLGILFSQEPCVTAGLFTTNRIKSAPVLLCQERLKKGRAVAVVVNSGCANASTGKQGLADAAEMATLTAKALGIDTEEVLVASTGVIGQRLPMERIRDGLNHVSLSDNGGQDLARAMMTTDTVPKETAVAVSAEGLRFTIGGVAKGSGMIHPNLGTLLCFLTTDAAVEPHFLQEALHRSADVSFNMVSIDGDTSPSDTLLLLANGMAGNPPISSGSQAAELFQQALNRVCIHLAKAVARDGEGATKLLEVAVNGAASKADAALAARTIVSSPLWKAAVYGRDPNWGRVVAALGRSGAEVIENSLDLHIGDVLVLKCGIPQSYDEAGVVRVLEKDEVPVTLNLNLGTASATAWGCDLTEKYVTINSQYTT